MADNMDCEAVDFSEEPFPDRVIFGKPDFTADSRTASLPSAPVPDLPPPPPTISLPSHSPHQHPYGTDPIDSSFFEVPPLSPGALHFLSSHTPPSPSFDPLSSTFFSEPSSYLPVTAASIPSSSRAHPSGSFETPAVKVRASKPSPLEGIPNPLVDHPSAPRTCKRKSKCVKATSREITIRLDEASTLDNIMDMANTVLVGHVRGRAYSAKQLSLWVKEVWGGVLSDLPEVHALPRGWFSLKFSNEAHTNLVLARYWHIEMAPVLLKRWSPLFDLEHEQIGARPIWVRLPGLPLQFWEEEVFIRIGNALGTYLDHDRTFIESRSRTLACILVYLDTRDELEEQITLQWGRCIRVQILDYEGVPFRCRRCHKVGHLYKDFSLIKKTEESPWITPAPSRTASPSSARLALAGLSPAASSPAVDPGIRQPSPPKTRACSAAEAGTVSGTSSFPCLSSFDNMIACCSHP